LHQLVPTTGLTDRWQPWTASVLPVAGVRNLTMTTFPPIIANVPAHMLISAIRRLRAAAMVSRPHVWD